MDAFLVALFHQARLSSLLYPLWCCFGNMFLAILPSPRNSEVVDHHVLVGVLCTNQLLVKQQSCSICDLLLRTRSCQIKKSWTFDNHVTTSLVAFPRKIGGLMVILKVEVDGMGMEGVKLWELYLLPLTLSCPWTDMVKLNSDVFAPLFSASMLSD